MTITVTADKYDKKYIQVNGGDKFRTSLGELVRQVLDLPSLPHYSGFLFLRGNSAPRFVNINEQSFTFADGGSLDTVTLAYATEYLQKELTRFVNWYNSLPQSKTFTIPDPKKG